MANDELIRKKDALDALMAERKHLLANGQKGAEHILTHHGYNVIDELDVPEINVGDMISRQAAMERLMAQNVIMDGSEYHNGFNAGVNRAQEVIRNLPPVQPKRTCVNCGRTVNNGGWYADGRTRCPIEEHYALPKDGYCHLWEKRNITDDDYPERRTDE